MKKSKLDSIKLRMRMKYYPFHLLEGVFMDINGRTMTIMMHEKYKPEIEKYFPKTLTLFLEKDEELMEFGSVNPVECYQEGHLIIVKFLLTKVNLNNVLFDAFKKINLLRLANQLPGKLYISSNHE